jgi:hypothetical protein
MKISRYNQFILERLGVPEGIVDSASRLYVEIINKFQNCNLNETLLDESDKSIEYSVDIPIQIKINQLISSEVVFTFTIKPILNPNIKLPGKVDVASWGVAVYPTEVKDMAFYHEPNSTTLDKIEIDNLQLRATFVSHETGTFGDCLALLKSSKNKTIGILSHELKHVYDKYMFGKENFDDIIDYATFANVRSGVDGVDEFIYNLYVISKSENLVRPSEVAGQIETIGLTKSEFMKFLEDLRLYKELKEIKNWTYQSMRESLRKDLPNIRNKRQGIPDDEPEDEIIDFLCEMTYESLTSEMSKKMKDILGIDNIVGLLTGKISHENVDFYTKYMKQRTYNNYEDFFAFWEKRLNFEGDKMIKKIAKLYDMCKDDNVNVLMDKISGRQCIVNPKLYNQLVLQPSVSTEKRPMPTK